MKTFTNFSKTFFLLCSFLYFLNTSAQAPNKMSYQAVIRNASNTLITNANVGMKISILQTTATGTVVFSEYFTPTTNSNGLVNLAIGNGTILTGNLATINWANGPYFIKTETDPTGGTNYTISGTTQFLSVPFALYAATSGSSASNWTTTGANIANNNSGNVGVGTGATAPTEKLEVVGKIKTLNLQVTTGAAVDRVLKSDATGNATWQNSNVYVTDVGSFSNQTIRNQWVDSPNLSVIIPESGQYLISIHGRGINNISNISVTDYDTDCNLRLTVDGSSLFEMTTIKMIIDIGGTSGVKKYIDMQPSRTIISYLTAGQELKLQYNQASFGPLASNTIWINYDSRISILKVGN